MELICDIFMYVDWVHTQNGGECIKSLILRRREDSFIWKVEVEMREKLRLAAWMTIANGKGETILHPDIKRMVANTFGIAKQIAVRQPIFLWTRPLVVVERHFAGFKGFLKRFPEICHWAVSVGNGPLYELRKYEPGRARPKPPRDFTAKGWTRRQIGYTLLTHDQVEECVGYVALITDGKYSATSNNCQKYVINLFECIREQDNVRDLFEDIRGFSCILNDRILRLRFQQYLRAWYLPSSDSVATPVEPMPMLIEQCIRNVLSAPPAIVAALSGMRFGSWFFICLMPAIGFPGEGCLLWSPHTALLDLIVGEEAYTRSASSPALSGEIPRRLRPGTSRFVLSELVQGAVPHTDSPVADLREPLEEPLEPREMTLNNDQWACPEEYGLADCDLFRDAESIGDHPFDIRV
ncbi:hypothetical protein FocnCong_v018256 [Fusarium oxysporum f. sp. conglutinans]|nr:hypothetical protein FocnCong_v018256 [Fusarium oxysporum f. sp. conglutinans]